MSHSLVQIQCANLDCLHPDNPLGQAICDRCQTPLDYRYLWAMNASHIPVETLVNDRYWVVRPQIWLDTEPGRAAEVPTLIPAELLPYLHLYPQRLHTPGLYGVCADAEAPAIVLLDNVPIDSTGQLFPQLDTVWQDTSPTRQTYWLWQLLQLWQSLKAEAVATSLLLPNNLHVEGWRVRLRELISDRTSSKASSETELPTSAPALKDLSILWLSWINQAHDAIAAPLQKICEQMQTSDETGFGAIAAQLNVLLLTQAAQLPLHLHIAGATTTGKRTHNEDSCFPTAASLDNELLPYVGIICDGIGGHEGGEVASQLALRSLLPQIRALLTELLEQTEPLSPEVVAQQLAGVVRVVNNLIAAQNDAHGRAMRQRMGTTLVMAVQLPQRVDNNNAHELYLVHVGDSRAYWLNSSYCHQLTVDDDLVTREVTTGRSPYQEVIRRPDGGALTQALGTRSAEQLEVNVQRFVIEEDGLLLLCSDGLSDYDRVEQSWQIAPSVLKGEESLQNAAQWWIDLANQQNGHDNTSVVLLRCWVNDRPVERIEDRPPDALIPVTARPDADAELAASSRALLYDEAPSFEPSVAPQFARKPGTLSFRLLVLVAFSIAVGILSLAVWQQAQPAAPPAQAPSSQPSD